MVKALQRFDFTEINYAIDRIKYYDELPNKAVLLEFLNNIQELGLLTEHERDSYAEEQVRIRLRRTLKDLKQAMAPMYKGGKPCLTTIASVIEELEADT